MGGWKLTMEKSCYRYPKLDFTTFLKISTASVFLEILSSAFPTSADESVRLSSAFPTSADESVRLNFAFPTSAEESVRLSFAFPTSADESVRLSFAFPTSADESEALKTVIPCVRESLSPPNTILGVDNKIYRRIYYVELSDTMGVAERLSPATPAVPVNFGLPTSLPAQTIPLPPFLASFMLQPSTSSMPSTPKTFNSSDHLPLSTLDAPSTQGPVISTPLPTNVHPHESPELMTLEAPLAADETISTVADPKDVPSEDAASEGSDNCEEDLTVEERGWNARYVAVDRRILLQLIRSSGCQMKRRCFGKVVDLREPRKPDGASYSVRGTCDLGHTWVWCSSEAVGNHRRINLDLAAATVSCGGNLSSLTEIAATMGLRFPSYRALTRLTSAFVFPAVRDLYDQKHKAILEEYRAKNTVCLATDSESDSGSYGKYTYTQVTFRDIHDDKIVHVELKQSPVAENSVVLENQGIEIGIQYLKEKGIRVTDLVTDRSRTVAKMLREVYPDISHHFDCWRVTKGVVKKLSRAGRTAAFKQLHTWVRSLINHLWRSLQRSQGDPTVAVKAWTVALKHITGDHTECLHEPYDPSEDRRDYLNPKDSVYEEAEKIICNKQLLSSLESYHSLKLKYAAKRLQCQYHGMKGRVLLSALDHNENIHRGKSKSKQSSSKATRALETKDKKVPETFMFRKDVVEMANTIAASSKERVSVRSSRETGEVRKRKGDIPKCVAAIKRPKPNTKELLALPKTERWIFEGGSSEPSSSRSGTSSSASPSSVPPALAQSTQAQPLLNPRRPRACSIHAGPGLAQSTQARRPPCRSQRVVPSSGDGHQEQDQRTCAFVDRFSRWEALVIPLLLLLLRLLCRGASSEDPVSEGGCLGLRVHVYEGAHPLPCDGPAKDHLFFVSFWVYLTLASITVDGATL
ncbi:unnamed protein product [Cyprideis torosa]|uniref:Uncharacterized protein n=1 Tax=Cyprideis torosa TaxID=163714 RepID=A0A7R8WLP2_9CRUS|nr:unnamed protein product [Cyprideis torosa]CAG0898300.1 unnamed protein product [Cyprideis torosa]